MDYGWISLLPIIIAVTLAFLTKDVFTALLSGVISSGLILSYYGETIFIGLNSIADVFLNGWAVRGLLIFLAEEKKNRKI
jgi:Na+/H+ antiporter NhaC